MKVQPSRSKLLWFVLIFCLSVAGCNWVSDIKIKVADTIDPPTPEEIEARKKQEQEEKQRKIQMIKDADALVQTWADKLHTKTDKNGGYIRHEGLTEADPWGKFIKIAYHQDVWEEVLTVTSPGPDRIYGTRDDLVRERRTTNFYGIWSGLTVETKFVIMWSSFAIVSFFLSLLLASKRHKRNKVVGTHDVSDYLLLSVFFAPFAYLYTCFMLLGLSVVETFDLNTDFFDKRYNFLDILLGD